MKASSLALGLAMGAAFAVTNLHVSLRTGWSLPVMTSAALVAAATRGRPAREVVLVATVASAAGYMAGGGNAAALPAFAMLGGTPRLLVVAAFWVATAAFGTLLAPLVRRGTDGLPFPTAAATAAVATTREASGVRSLTAAAVTGAAAAALRSALRLPALYALPGGVRGLSFASLTVGLEPSALLIGAGALMRGRTALSTLLGGALTYLVIAPELVARGLVAEGSYRSIVGFMVWPSASMTVAAALVDLAAASRARSELAASAPRWAAAGAVAAVAAGLGAWAFGVSLFWMLAAVPLALALGTVAARSMGETDVVPTKALGSITQLAVGAAGASVSAVVAAPNLAAAAALHAADTLSSLAAARAADAAEAHVVRARLAGIAVGAAAAMGAYAVLVPDALALPTPELPAPAVLVWRSVAEGIGRGLPAATLGATAAGAVAGAALALAGRHRARVPSPLGLASGFVLPASNAIAIALGALARNAAERRGLRHAVPVAAGLVAGESLVTVAIQVAQAARLLVSP